MPYPALTGSLVARRTPLSRALLVVLAGLSIAPLFGAATAQAVVAHRIFTQIADLRAYHVDLSADGATAIFLSAEDPLGANPDKATQIFLFQEDHGLAQVTHHTSADGTFTIVPRVSGDGSVIGVISNRNFAGLGGSTDNELYVGTIGTGAVIWERIAPGVVFSNGSLAVADDGLMAVATKADLDGPNAGDFQEIFFYRHGQGFEQVTAPDVCNYGQHVADISGDGSTVVFHSNCSYGAINPSRSFELFTWSAAAGIHQLTAGGKGMAQVALDADGDVAAIYSKADLTEELESDFHLYRWTLAGGFERLTDTPISASSDNGHGSFREPSISADGSIIAFDSATEVGGILPGNIGVNTLIWRGGKIVALTTSEDGTISQGNMKPRLSADGRRVLVNAIFSIDAPADDREGPFLVDIVDFDPPTTNLLANGTFDDAVLTAGWALGGTGMWSSLDAHQNYLSGSLTGGNFSADPSSVEAAAWQCVAALAGREYVMTAQLAVEPTAEPGAAEVVVETFDSADCSGTATHRHAAGHERADDRFAGRFGRFETSATTRSIRVSPSVRKEAAGGVIDARFDDLSLHLLSGPPFFADGFESGDLVAWSGSAGG